MDPASIAAPPGVLELAGRSFVITPPAPGDMLRVSERMRELAHAKCISPIDFAVKHAHLPPALFAVVVSEALKLGAGGGVKPTPDSVWDEYTTLDGVRYRVWYHASRVLKDLHPDDLAELITPDNLLDVAESLDRALRLDTLAGEKKVEPTGAT